MEDKNRVAVAGICISVLLAVAGGGLKMTGYVNPDLGWVLVVVGLGGAAWIAVRTWLPDFLPLPQFWRGASRRLAVVPWREGEALLDRFDELAVNAVYRSDSAWDEKYQRFEASLTLFETAAQQASTPYHDEYREACQRMREALSQAPSSGPVGKAQYLSLSRSGVIKGLRSLVHRDRLKFSDEKWSSKGLETRTRAVEPGAPLGSGYPIRCRLHVDIIPLRRFDQPHVLRIGFNLQPDSPTAQFLDKPDGPVRRIAPEPEPSVVAFQSH